MEYNNLEKYVTEFKTEWRNAVTHGRGRGECREIVLFTMFLCKGNKVIWRKNQFNLCMLGIFERSASSMAAATRALASALRVYRFYLLLHTLRTTIHSQQVTLLIQPFYVLTCSAQHIWYIIWRTDDETHSKMVLYKHVTFDHMYSWGLVKSPWIACYG